MDFNQIEDWFTIPIGAIVYECQSGINSPAMKVIRTVYMVNGPEFNQDDFYVDCICIDIEYVSDNPLMNGVRDTYCYNKDNPQYKPKLYYSPQYVQRD